MISSGAAQRDSLLFVYGTLRGFVDIPMARRLRSASRYIGQARVKGRLYDLGRYPGLVSARRRDEWVIGEIYRLVAPRVVLRMLDRYEAGRSGRQRPRFVRERAYACIPGRRRAFVVWVYCYRWPLRPDARIRSGDYRRHLAGRYRVPPEQSS
jgi:gamma-glutamylcyclotransferase (GGCT)/AIG2-like uncharacterized protein YtfP